jgi:hypothetical protein
MAAADEKPNRASERDKAGLRPPNRMSACEMAAEIVRKGVESKAFVGGWSDASLLSLPPSAHPREGGDPGFLKHKIS